MKLEKMIEDVKRDCMYYILSNMRKNELSMQETRVLSKDILAMFPVQTPNELLAKLKQLSKTHKVMQEVFIKYAKRLEEEQKEYVLKNIPAYLQMGDVENALILLKGGVFHG